jgi:hypothetical protein
MLKRWFTRFVGIFDPAGVRKYVTQLTLILISLLLATRADRCREAGKEQAKLREYLIAIQADIEDEIKTDKMNLVDTKRDEKCLIQFFSKCYYDNNDSLYEAYSNFAEVYQRGVFRAFPPTTFDLMAQSGDANLLKDLPLRNSLASVFAFRQNVIQKDLENFDEQTQVCAEKLGRFFDLSLMFAGVKEQFLYDKKAFLKDPHNEVLLLYRSTGLRAFHLETAIEDLKETQKELDAYLQKL